MPLDPNYNPGKPNILIVDDNPSFIKRLITLLAEVKTIGQIDIAGEHAEAARIFIDKNPDIVLLDIAMPGENGMKLLKQIRESGSRCKVIILSNRTGDSYRDYCSRLGADYFLDKSYDFAKIPMILSLIQSEAGQCLN
jgi:DNA-binding NarL/FixJ family response regulator